MRVKVTKDFKWAPDGNHVRTVKAGEELEGRGAQVALQLSSGEELRETPGPDHPSILHSKPGKGR